MEITINNKKTRIRTLYPSDSICELVFSNPYENRRVLSLIKQAGIETIEDLCLQNRTQLLCIAQLGEVSLERIIHALYVYGYHLGMTPDQLAKIEANKGLCNKDDVLGVFKEHLESLISKAQNEPIFLNDGELDTDKSSEKESQPADFDWDNYFREIAKDEFYRLGSMTDIKSRTSIAIRNATTFFSTLQCYMEHKQ